MKRYLRFLSNFLIIVGLVLLIVSFGPLVKDEVWYFLKQVKKQDMKIKSDGVKDSVFARFLSSKPIDIEPVSTDFSIVIEKIGVNAPVVGDVSVGDEKAYMSALKSGVAHASISPYPSSEPGNVYLFAHASLNFWGFGKYATVFNLLRKLEPGDKIHIFYKSQMFVYSVLNIEKFKGWDTYPISRPVMEPILTLQTCDPPGTTLNRLVVTAKLENIESLK